jgi:hypothetical protein
MERRNQWNNTFQRTMLLVTILASLALVSAAAAVQLPRTGQTNSYSSSDDGDIMAGKAWPQPRFTDNGTQTVSDNLTGLTWAKEGNLLRNRDPGFDTDGIKGDGAVTWQHALDYIQRLNIEKYLGHTDWRLPNLNELNSLTSQGEAHASTWLNSQGFVGVQPLLYWWSTTNIMNSSRAWAITLAEGSLDSKTKSGLGHVWGYAAENRVELPLPW